MLEVTPVAAEVIKELVTTSSDTTSDTPWDAPSAPESSGAGLRFSLRGAENSHTSLELSVGEAVDGDQVVAVESGAVVIMSPDAARYLDDKVLDIRDDGTGQPAFAIARQA